MAQFGSGKAPPPWQTRGQASIQSSLLGQHPNASTITNPQLLLGAPQPPQYASVQQSMIQPPGLGSLQPLSQSNPQPPMQPVCPNLGQPSQTSIGQGVALLGQPPLNSQSLVSHTQLSTLPQMQPQVTSVTYPPPRPAVFTAGTTTMPGNSIQPNMMGGLPPAPNMTTMAANNSHPPPKQRVFTGTITKLCTDFGFVDEDVFFQTSCVKGVAPKMGDRVLVEATFNPNMPFKWNANRVQVISAPINTTTSTSRTISQPNFTGRSVYNAVPPPTYNAESSLRPASGRRSRSPRRDRRDETKRRDTRLERDDKDKDIKRESRKRSRSRDRSRSPRRRPRLGPRYNVQIPKIMVQLKEANVLELRKRYSNLYIPSDVFMAKPLWSDTFPPHRCFQFPRSTSFHILSKEVSSPVENTAVYDPPDVNHSYAAKVMLMSVPSMEDIYKRSCGLSEDTNSRSSFVHPTRLIHFLVGLKGKNETMAIGGYWSPSLDGSNPEGNPTTLIRTAIRTCKALTGIDLSACTTCGPPRPPVDALIYPRYRFAEIYYMRGESSHKGRTIPARVETTVLFLPDVWNLCPTKLEWDGLQSSYRHQLERRLQASEPSPEAKPEVDEAEAVEGEEKESENKDPSHWSTLDPKTMKVVDLRDELNTRLQNSKGLKSQLIARLTKALKAEQEKEKQDSCDNVDENTKKDEDHKKKEEERREDERLKAEEKERIVLEKRYTLPDQPMVLVHPSRSAKSGKFDCTVMSLSVLLDYRQEDNKEHSFEVSLFAELFNEMLMRDFSFRIYRALVETPERSKEERKDRDKKKDDKDDKKEKKVMKDEDKKAEKETEKKCDKEEAEKKDDDMEEDEIEEEFDEDIDEDDSKDGVKCEKDKKRERQDTKDRKEKKERRKMITVDPYLLLSFVYFDQTHTGYIFDKDVEDIINILGVNLSRAQLKKLVAPFLSREALHYRRLTDVVVEDKDTYVRETNSVDLELLAKGNQVLLAENCDAPMKNESDADKRGLIEYEGSLTDIGQLVNLLERSEKARTDTEEKLKEVQKDLSTCKDETKKSQDKISKLTKESKTCQVNLKATEEELKKVLEDNVVYQKSLQQIRNVIKPLFSGVDDTSDVKEVVRCEENGV